MSKLEELIAELCPDGVEYKSLHGCLPVWEILSGSDNFFEGLLRGGRL